ncbi:alginate O-acetyltransferase AlgX-related protein [Dankookia sp. P2]|uniref:alginate O-acetyltransferase AlgX-related protein n=1 Tax=Dankookia sp. P2 TaxID=3423955 RepID=UPI003D66870F
MTNPASDLVRFLPADQRAKYPPETYQIREPQAAGGLLDGDDGADVVVVGNSFAQPKYGFVPLLAAQLDRPVGLAWRPNNYGPWFTLLEYLKSDGFRRRRPKALVWMHLGFDLQNQPNSSSWGRMRCRRRLSWRRSGGRSADDPPPHPGRLAAGRPCPGATPRPGAGAGLRPAAAARLGLSALRQCAGGRARAAAGFPAGPGARHRPGPAGHPYAVVERAAGRHLALEAASAGATGRAVLGLEPGSYVTLLLHRGADGGIAATPVTDSADFDRAKARLGFYNAAPGCPAAALRLASNHATVFDQVAPGTARARTVNPVSAALRAECGEAAVGLPAEGFEAGGSYSILLIRPEGAAPAALLVRDSTARWRP